MVNTEPLNAPSPNGSDSQLSALPEVVSMSKADLQRFPSPGTQRALKAETGRDYMQLVGPDADSADRTQTQIWMFLRRTHKDLRWDQCEDIEMVVDAEGLSLDPTSPGISATLPPSAASGA